MIQSGNHWRRLDYVERATERGRAVAGNRSLDFRRETFGAHQEDTRVIVNVGQQGGATFALGYGQRFLHAPRRPNHLTDVRYGGRASRFCHHQQAVAP